MNEKEIENMGNYLLKKYTKKTAKAYQREIENYISNNHNNKKYSYTEIIKYIGVLRNKYNNARTINRMLCSIKAYYSYLTATNQRRDNPTKSIHLKDKQSRDIQLQDLFTTAELEALLTAKQERYTHLDYRNKVLISLLIYQALKPTEMEQLQVTEINLEAATIYIKASAKNNNRTLALKANQILLFQKYLDEIRPKLLKEKASTFLLIGIRGTAMCAEDISKHIKRIGKYFPLGGLKGLNAMTIRQSVITNLLKQHNDLRIVQAFAGHKYTSTTERYKQNNVELLQAAVDKYHPMK